MGEVRTKPDMTKENEFQARYRGPPHKVLHAALTRAGDETPFRSIAPCCGGMLLVRRNQVTFELSRDDNCVKCGQRYWYTDDSINGERFGEPVSP
jgi:hypothetical protein